MTTTRYAEFYVEFKRAKGSDAAAIRLLKKLPKSDAHGPIVRFHVALPEVLFAPQADVRVEVEAEAAQAEAIQIPVETE